MELLEALLLMAAEHRERAENERMFVSDLADSGPFKWLSDTSRKSAAEQDGLADVYERMADILVTAVWLDYASA